jgi:hypothetical protein
MNLKQIEKSIISRKLVLFFIQFIVARWEDVFYNQIKDLWLKHAKYQNFNEFLIDQLLDPKGFRIIKLRFNLILEEYMRYPWVYEDFIEYCKKYKVFSKFLSSKKDIMVLERNHEVIILLVGINLMLFRLISFTITRFKFLKRKKYISYNFLLDYLDNPFFCFDLLEDLITLKYKIKTVQDRKTLLLDKVSLEPMLKICKYKGLFKKIKKVNNKLIC